MIYYNGFYVLENKKGVCFVFLLGEVDYYFFYKLGGNVYLVFFLDIIYDSFDFIYLLINFFYKVFINFVFIFFNFDYSLVIRSGFLVNIFYNVVFINDYGSYEILYYNG